YLLYTAADKTTLARRARGDEFDIETLRRCYAQLRRTLGAGWGVVSAEEITPPGLVEAGQDLRVALGILERAGLLERGPDAPRGMEVVIRQSGSVPADERWPGFLAASGLCPGERGQIDTVAVATALGLSPAGLEQTLLTWAEETGAIQVAGITGRRDLCLWLVLPPPPDAAASLPALLEEVRRENERRVARMVAFATGRTCRHAALAAHLGERLRPCGTQCDVCASAPTTTTRSARSAGTTAPPAAAKTGARPATPEPPPQIVDANTALTVLACLGAMPFGVGKTGLTKVLTGSIAASVKGDRVRQFGALAGLPQGRINGLIDRLIADGFIARDESGEYPRLSLTPAGRAADGDVLAAYNAPPPTNAVLSVGRAPGNGAADSAEGVELTAAQAALFERLKAWRTAQAAERAVPPYVIAHDRMLRELAVQRPATHEELLAIKGFGPAKVDTYGDELLALLAAG
ncbi:MAG: HRDC domain-containing protein, partial [Chloroflexota bacterium]|nr:HRDC domain-containing protein [Chloroflexota bacterium]